MAAQKVVVAVSLAAHTSVVVHRTTQVCPPDLPSPPQVRLVESVVAVVVATALEISQGAHMPNSVLGAAAVWGTEVSGRCRGGPEPTSLGPRRPVVGALAGESCLPTCRTTPQWVVPPPDAAVCMGGVTLAEQALHSIQLGPCRMPHRLASSHLSLSYFAPPVSPWDAQG